MTHVFLVSAILISATAQTEGRRPSMLGGKSAAKKAEVKKTAAPPVKKKAEAPPVEKRAVSEEDQAQALAKYNEIKDKTPHTASAQSRLAAWCEEHGLQAEAYLHYGEVIRLDRKRESAWRKLGFRKYGKRWMTEEQIAEVEAQKEADKVWAPRLRKIHRDIHGNHGTKKRDAARTAFTEINDGDAVLSLYREFGTGQADQNMLLAILTQIDTPMSSKVLAMLAVYGRNSDIRRRATEILRMRKADDYLELLVGLMVDTIKYQVKPVAGPGSPGAIFVEGKRFNVSRLYAPPPTPGLYPRPGDMISYDALGMPVINRPLAVFPIVGGAKTGKSGAMGLEEFARYSATQMIIESERQAAAAEAQLQGDVARIKAFNAVRRHFNELVIAVARYATGKDHGQDPEDWRKAIGRDVKKYKESEKPTMTQLIPLAYRPRFAQIGNMRTLLGSVDP